MLVQAYAPSPSSRSPGCLLSTPPGCPWPPDGRCTGLRQRQPSASPTAPAWPPSCACLRGEAVSSRARRGPRPGQPPALTEEGLLAQPLAQALHDGVAEGDVRDEVSWGRGERPARRSHRAGGGGARPPPAPPARPRPPPAVTRPLHPGAGSRPRSPASGCTRRPAPPGRC